MFKSSQEWFGRAVTLCCDSTAGGGAVAFLDVSKAPKDVPTRFLRTTVLHFVELDSFVLIISVWATEEANVVRL